MNHSVKPAENASAETPRPRFRFVRFYLDYYRLVGDVWAALVLEEAAFRSRTTPGGWFELSHVDWNRALGLSRFQLYRACRELQKHPSFWSQKRAGQPARLFYHVDGSALFRAVQALRSELVAAGDESKWHETCFDVRNRTSRCAESHNQMSESAHLDVRRRTSLLMSSSDIKNRHTPPPTAVHSGSKSVRQNPAADGGISDQEKNILRGFKWGTWSPDDDWIAELVTQARKWEPTITADELLQLIFETAPGCQGAKNPPGLLRWRVLHELQGGALQSLRSTRDARALVQAEDEALARKQASAMRAKRNAKGGTIH